jgi:hypothetical protein
MSRGILLLFKNSGESKAKRNYIIFAATGCGFFFWLQQLLVVVFPRPSD